jgi:type II secretion system (T2SS) protein K
LALSLVTEAMTRWVSAALDSALSNREEVDARRQIAVAEAVALYLLTTRPLSSRGIELLTPEQLYATTAASFLAGLPLAESYIRLDDQRYRFDSAILRLQDVRGLINLNAGSDFDLFALLGVFGVPADDRGPLIAKLRDYIDADSLTRLNGAEAPQYEEAGLEPPANAPLRGPWEVRRILDWDKIEGLAKEDSPWPLLAATASQLRGFNINTAPPTLLSLMPMMTPDAVQRVVERRRQQPIVTDFDFELLTGFSIAEPPPTHFIPFPADNLILTLSAKNWPLERRIAIRQTLSSPDRPWVVDYDVETPRAVRDATEPDPDDLPLSQLLSSTP